MDKSTQIPPDSFAARLKQAMAMRNLKQETLAEAAGVSQNTIHKLTSGKAQSTRKLIEIAAALGVSPGGGGTRAGPPPPPRGGLLSTKPPPPALVCRRATHVASKTAR